MAPSKPGINNIDTRTVGGVTVYSVAEANNLTQLIGWLKFSANVGDVLYRGQGQMHRSMTPSAFRGLAVSGRNKNIGRINSYITELYGRKCSCAGNPTPFNKGHLCMEVATGGHCVVGGTYRAALEPLLQHYGVRTRWIDVVDNVWVALWFACHKQISKDQYAFYARRSPAQEPDDAKAYIAVLGTGKTKETGIPGYRLSPDCRVVDLRYCVPSVYLRPHAQHGLLMAQNNVTPTSDGTLTSAVVGYIEIRLLDAIEWLGTGMMISNYVLFPPAVRDEGYRALLEYAPAVPGQLGHLVQYGPGY